MFAVSPRIAARARERYRVAAVKDDRLDALVLADTLRYEHPQWRALTPPSPLLAEIRALTRDRDRLQQTQQAVESQLRAILEAYHPAPTRLFSSVDRQITLHFVPDKSYSAQSFTRLLQLLNTQLAEYDDAIAAAAAEHPDTPIFASFPGVGDVLTGVLLAEIGEDRTRFPAANVLLAEAGLAPVTRSSGRSRKVRFRYAANTILREATTWWAYNSMKEAPWAKAAFRDARDRRASTTTARFAASRPAGGVADGRIGASVMLANKPWDAVAGVLIAREAGAEVLDRNGYPYSLRFKSTVAVAPQLRAQLLGLLQLHASARYGCRAHKVGTR